MIKAPTQRVSPPGVWGQQNGKVIHQPLKQKGLVGGGQPNSHRRRV
jgi:hypothetical protein